MSATEYYNHSTYPAQGASGSSSAMRSELELIEAGFGKLPDLAGNGSKLVAINSGGTAMETITSLTVAQGGTGRVTGTSAYALVATGTSATAAQQSLAVGATTEILVGGGNAALPVWTAATGSGAPVRANTPALVAPILGIPTSGTLTNCTGLPAAGVTGTALVAAAIGTTVQAYDAQLDTWSGVAPGTGVATALAVNVGTAGAVVVNGGALGTPLSGNLANCTGYASSGLIPTGATFDYVGSSAPSGYVLLDGKTIGNGSSGGTERADADTSDLFTLLWNSMADAQAAVSGGRGASAAADFAANKTITLPDARGRTIAGRDDMGGSTASRLTNAGAGIVGTTLGVAGGSQTHTLVTAELASHTHGILDNNGLPAVYIGSGGGPSPLWGGTGGDGSPRLTAAAGSGTAHNNTQPTLVLNKIIKL